MDSQDHNIVLDRVLLGKRLAPKDALMLFETCPLAALGHAADTVARRLHPENYRTYNIDRNINYSNICAAECRFCAFYRSQKAADGYLLEPDTILAKIEETVELGGDQILLQGGLHPTLPLAWYENLLRTIKKHYPQINPHAFSAPEIHHFAKRANISVREVLQRLQAAGLGSLPGGGAEILVDRVRREISRNKVQTEDWLDIHRQWHRLGGRSTATMMFGHIESHAERIEHLDRIRTLQDETAGFTAFIGWTFQPNRTAMAEIAKATPFDYLRTLAITRLFLDNIPNIQASWVTQGLKIGQLALCFGANDMGSLMIEENVVAETGTTHQATLDQIRDAITELGFQPRQRNVFYELLEPAQELGG